MRLTEKKIEEIIVAILGVDSLSLLKQFYARDNISEFDLANKTKKDIKVIRKMLYVLYNHNLVSFTRKKDKQKGWYVYYWTLQPESIRHHYFKRKREELVELKRRLETEQLELYFSCPKKCVRMNFDQAMNFEFHCPECGDLAVQENSDDLRLQLKQRIGVLEEDIKGAIVEKKVQKSSAKARKKVVKAKVKAKKTIKKKVKKKR